jgi:hypothetical protein
MENGKWKVEMRRSWELWELVVVEILVGVWVR